MIPFIEPHEIEAFGVLVAPYATAKLSIGAPPATYSAPKALDERQLRAVHAQARELVEAGPDAVDSFLAQLDRANSRDGIVDDAGLTMIRDALLERVEELAQLALLPQRTLLALAAACGTTPTAIALGDE